MAIMVCKEHGHINSFRFPVAPILAVVIVIFLILFDACRTEGSLPLNKWINGDTVQVRSKHGITSFNGKQANGILFYLAEDGDTLTRSAWFMGKEEGEARAWYDDAQLKEIRRYHNGKKTGTHHGWYDNGTMKFEYNYYEDEFHGEYKEWYASGDLLRLQHFNKGHEEGMQTTFFPGEKIKSNYLIKNNRRYGLPGSQNCVNASDSIAR
jgi:antitoxin component YwqK of YwqJK toxin-antitoxin module